MQTVSSSPRFPSRSWLGFVLAWSFITMGLLGTYANLRLGNWPVLHFKDTSQNGLIDTWSFFFQPLLYPILLLIGIIWAWRFRRYVKALLHHAHLGDHQKREEKASTRSSQDVQSSSLVLSEESQDATQSKASPSPLKPTWQHRLRLSWSWLSCAIGIVCGIVLGLLVMLAVCWKVAAYQAYQSSMKYSMEVKAFSWLYELPSHANDKHPTLLKPIPSAELSQASLQKVGRQYAFEDTQCVEARDALQRWVKDTHDSFGFVLQQDMVFLNYKHGCLKASDVWEYNDLLKVRAEHSATMAEVVFPWLFGTAREGMIDTLTITPQKWCEVDGFLPADCAAKTDFPSSVQPQSIHSQKSARTSIALPIPPKHH